MKINNRRNSVPKIAILLVILIAFLVVAHERQNLYDELALYHYHPSAVLQSLATQDGMTSYTRRVFYVNHPQIDEKNLFATVCPNNSEQMVVLGCYHNGQNGIFLLSVTDSQLYGLEQVTAAYETLHAIYERLPPDQQKQLNKELTSFENNGLNNPTVSAQIADFRKTEPGEVLNETTSLFGTEVTNLPPALSAFYAKYFTNRQTLLNYYNDYESAFTSRQQQITAYDGQLSTLNSQITSEQSTLNNQLSNITSQQTSLNADRNSGQIDAYNQGVNGYNQLVDQYNEGIASLKGQVNRYNQTVDQRNSIVLEEQQLTKDITSPLEPVVH